MYGRLTRLLVVSLVCLLAIVWLAGLCQAAQPAAKPAAAGAGATPGAPPPTVATPPAPPADDPMAKEKEEKPLREQSIYIPYEKLRKVFEKEGRGVFLPYEKFRELWQAAQEKRWPPRPSRPSGP